MKLFHYYQAERIKRGLLLAVMTVLLCINLFPIAWMVFCSFKNNNDILSGNVGFSRAQTDIYSIYPEGSDLYAFSIDGSITRMDMKTKKILGRLTIKGQDSNYVQNGAYFYFCNSNRGLYKIDKKTLKILAHTPMPIRGVDTNKFGNTSIEVSKKNLYFTVELKGIRRIFVYDKVTLQKKREINLPLPESAFLRSFFLKEGQLFVGTDQSLLQFDLEQDRVVRSVELQNYYPSGVEKVIAWEGDRLLLLVQNGVVFIDLLTNKVLEQKNYGVIRFEDAVVRDNLLYVSHPDGLTVVDIKTDQVIANQKKLMKELKDGVLVNHLGDYTSNELTTLCFSGEDLILGSSHGRLSFMKMGQSKPYMERQLEPGYRLVKFSNYSDLWKNIDFGLYLKNSVIISGFTMIFSMILATLAAYALVRYNFRGNREFGIAILSTQMIPQIMYLIPLFIMFKWVTDVTGIPIKGTYAGLIFIYTAFFVPFSIWILRSFFATIPFELEESARIDGCNGFQVFYKISLPLAIPGIIATGIYIFLTAWDELMFAWVLTNGQTLTIPIGIRLFVGNYQNRYDLMMAAATVATVPVLILFFLLQKHIVKGLTAGAVKG
ncbi:MAG: ABC transporter permease subunit [Candidatus Margulisiibacteriota bacterium]